MIPLPQDEPSKCGARPACMKEISILWMERYRVRMGERSLRDPHSTFLISRRKKKGIERLITDKTHFKMSTKQELFRSNHPLLSSAMIDSREFPLVLNLNFQNIPGCRLANAEYSRNLD